MTKIRLQKNQQGSMYMMKAIACALAIVLCGGFSNTANAYFIGSSLSANAVFSVGTLNLALDSSDTYTSPVLYPSESSFTAVSLFDTGSIASQHTASTTVLGGESACNYVTLVATSTSGGLYSGSLKDFVLAATSTGSTWNYRFTVQAGAPPAVWGSTCFFKFTYSAWQKNFSAPTQGFTDSEEKAGSVRIGKAVVLNEFLSDPVGVDNAPKPAGEWVELYNNSGTSINLAGWVLYDNTDSHELYILPTNTNTGGTTISAHGYLVVYRNGDSDFDLNNSGDSVRLATGYPIASSVVVDSYTYSTSKPAGFSYARIPDGIGAWVDPVPTPGEPNEDTLGTTAPPESEPESSFLGDLLDSFNPLIVPIDETLPVLDEKQIEAVPQTEDSVIEAPAEKVTENAEENTEHAQAEAPADESENVPSSETENKSGIATPADVPGETEQTPESAPAENAGIDPPKEDQQIAETPPPLVEPIVAPVDNPTE